MKKIFTLSTLRVVLLATTIALAGIQSVAAQTPEPFMAPASPATDQLSQQQRGSFQKMQLDSAYEWVQMVKMGDVSKVQKDGHLVFSLPGSDKQWKAKTDRVQARSRTDYTYSAKLDDSTSFVLLVCEQGRIRGHLSLDGEIYEIHPVADGLHALVKFNQRRLAAKACHTDGRERIKPLPHQPAPAGKTSGRLEACAYIGADLRVLTLFTPGARAQDANIGQTISLAVFQVNQAFRNSQVTASVEIVSAGTLEYNLPGGETGDIAVDANRLAADPVVNNLRIQRDADLVMLITRDAYGGIAGFARTSFNLLPGNAYAIATVGTATAQYTYAHELGHLLGARHQQCSVWNNPLGGCDDAPGINHGYSYIGRRDYFVDTEPRPRSTIMHQAGRRHTTLFTNTDYVQILNYSNPNVEVERRATGTGDRNNNAAWISNNFSTVRDYLPSAGRLWAYIEGPTSLDYNRIYSWEAVYACGRGPYTFEWAVSSDGFNYGSIRGTGETFASWPGFLYFAKTIRCIVTSAEGQRFTAYKNVTPSGNARISAETRDTGAPTEATVLHDAFPNPASDQATIGFTLAEPAEVRLKVFGQLGRKVAVLADGQYPSGQHAKSLAAASLPPGLYFYRLSANGVVQSKRLVIVR